MIFDTEENDTEIRQQRQCCFEIFSRELKLGSEDRHSQRVGGSQEKESGAAAGIGHDGYGGLFVISLPLHCVFAIVFVSSLLDSA